MDGAIPPIPPSPPPDQGHQALTAPLWRSACYWVLSLGFIGLSVGSACALFLWLLDWAQVNRNQHLWLIALLPLAGVMIAWLYQRWGGAATGGMATLLSGVEAGNQQPSAQAVEDDRLGADAALPPTRPVPRRMAPLILLTTVLTHVFGGSAGREGTAVQMGGSLASWAASLRPLGGHRLPLPSLLIAGMAAGFAGLFGTPWAAVVFSLEVPRLSRRQRLDALLPAIAAAWLAYEVAHLWGTLHAPYPSLLPASAFVTWLSAWFSAPYLFMAIIMAIACAVVARCYLLLHDAIHSLLKATIGQPLFRPFIGGLAVLLLVGISGSTDYLGLGVQSADPTVVTVTSSFVEGGAEADSWLWKLLFTATTLGSGFKGGEVTPLFYIGATLGHSLALFSVWPVAMAAGMGMMGLFAAASRAPLACALMGAELFGWNILPLLLVVCYLATVLGPHKGIYAARRHPANA